METSLIEDRSPLRLIILRNPFQIAERFCWAKEFKVPTFFLDIHFIKQLSHQLHKFLWSTEVNLQIPIRTKVFQNGSGQKSCK